MAAEGCRGHRPRTVRAPALRRAADRGGARLARHAHAGRPIPAAQPSRAAAGLLLGGLLTGILPLAGVGTTGDILRPIVVVSVSAALLLIGSFLRAPAPTRWFLDAIALAGGVGLIVGAFGRALGMTSRGELADPMLDAWVLVGAVVLVAAAFGQALPRTDDDAGFRRIGSQALGIVGMAGILVVEGVALRDERLGDLRAILLVVLFAASICSLALSIALRSPAWSAGSRSPSARSLPSLGSRSTGSTPSNSPRCHLRSRSSPAV